MKPKDARSPLLPPGTVRSGALAGGHGQEEHLATQGAEDSRCAPGHYSGPSTWPRGRWSRGRGWGAPCLESWQLSHARSHPATDTPAARAPVVLTRAAVQNGFPQGTEALRPTVAAGSEQRPRVTGDVSSLLCPSRCRQSPERRCWEQTAPEGSDVSDAV